MPWSEPGNALAWLAVCFVSAMAGTWLARRYAVNRNLLDQPGARRSHDVATPRGGGVAIAIVLLLACIWLALRTPMVTPMLTTFAAGLAMIAAIGWLDDHRPMSPWLRLVVHALASALFAIGTWLVTSDLRLAACAFVATVVLTNVWNFMDGIDGMAATQAIFVAAVLAWLTAGAWSWLALALLAATLGFLPFNFPRASIFLGDVGSGVLGYATGGLLTAAIMIDTPNWTLLLLPLSVFLVDAGLTLLRRLLRGEPWWTAHTQHAYQKWSRRLQSHVPVTAVFALWTVMAVALAISLRDAAFTCRIIMLLAWYALTVVLWLAIQYGIAHGEIDQSNNRDI